MESDLATLDFVKVDLVKPSQAAANAVLKDHFYFVHRLKSNASQEDIKLPIALTWFAHNSLHLKIFENLLFIFFEMRWTLLFSLGLTCRESGILFEGVHQS